MSIVVRGKTNIGPVFTSASEITGPSGFYSITSGDDIIKVYIDQDYDGGGWILVLANRKDTGGMNNLTYIDAVNSQNYRANGTSKGSNDVVDPGSIRTNFENYNVWIGTKFWLGLAGRVTSNKITVVQFVATSNVSLSGSHTKRYRWRFDNFGATYGMVGAASISDETATGAPGFYSSHAVGGYSLTTFDNDQDSYGSNCSNSYGNNPWWYSACWAGNYFAGGGYQDASYWAGSSTDYHNYGAVYIK